LRRSKGRFPLVGGASIADALVGAYERGNQPGPTSLHRRLELRLLNPWTVNRRPGPSRSSQWTRCPDDVELVWIGFRHVGDVQPACGPPCLAGPCWIRRSRHSKKRRAVSTSAPCTAPREPHLGWSHVPWRDEPARASSFI